MKKLKITSIPSPQIISPGEWVIKEGDKAGVNIAAKEYIAPFDISKESSYTRAHEYAHIKWSTTEAAAELAKRWEIDVLSVAICEDGRMSKKLDERGIRIPDTMLTLLNTSDEYSIASHIVISASQWEQLCNIYGVDESFRDRIKFIIDVIDDLKTASQRFDSLFHHITGKIELDKASTGSPGEMFIHEPPLQRKFNTFIKKNHSEGFIFTSPQRIMTDKLCFKRKVKKKFKGSVLIDVSGSMGWNKKRLLSLVEKIPAATIACYSGDGVSGDLYIVAKNGCVVDKLPNFDGMNVVDIPAIEWLTQQSSPRIWLGDGGVTGVHDGPLTYTWKEYLDSIITQYNVVRYERESKFLENFK